MDIHVSWHTVFGVKKIKTGNLKEKTRKGSVFSGVKVDDYK